MKKYDFSVDGISVSVYPSDYAQKDRVSICESLSGGEYAVLLYPDEQADCYAVCFDKNNNEPREPYICLAALFCFFDRVCAYPKMSIDVKYGGSVYELSLRSNEYKFSDNVGKCKILCTKTVKFADGVEIDAYTVGNDSPVLSLICEDSELFDKERLKLLIASSSFGEVRSAVAISFSDRLRITSLFAPLFYETITAAVSLLLAKGIKLPESENVCLLDGTLHKFAFSNGNLIFYPSVKYIS